MERFSLFIKENIRLILGVAVVIFALLLLLTLLFSRKSTKVIVEGQTFIVKVAKTDKEKQIGLSETKKLDKNKGMLFVFDTADYYAFWMKNMKFPIDIIYVNGNKVTTVIHQAQPTSLLDMPIYQPNEKSDKVLEINSGLSKTYNIKAGSVVKIQNL
jgi:uncharacterized membrane protein (UPF0127 family)